jgi:hypothetical protein
MMELLANLYDETYDHEMQIGKKKKELCTKIDFSIPLILHGGHSKPQGATEGCGRLRRANGATRDCGRPWRGLAGVSVGCGVHCGAMVNYGGHKSHGIQMD